MALGVASVADLLRLVVLPAFAWAAYRDLRTRRLPNLLWPPLILVGLVALGLDVFARLPLGDDRLFLVRVAFALGFLLPFAFLAYWFRAFGGADAKAIATLAVVLPVTPTYRLPPELLTRLPPEVVTALPRLSLPLYPSLLGVTAVAVLTNAVVTALGYVVWLALQNLLAGRLSTAMVVGRPTAAESLPERHGSLLVTDGLVPRTGLDLDALRMYLRWRGCTLAELRADPGLRDPATVGETYEPTDGAVHREPEWPSLREGGPRPAGVSADDERATPDADAAGDGWEGTGFVPAAVRRVDGGDAAAEPPDRPAGGEEVATTAPGDGTDGPGEADPWAAAAFLSEIDGSAYGTTPERLREGLETVTDENREAVWVSPGLPFVVPLFLGLVAALCVGDLLTLALRASGLF